jgi:protein-L-isoaspartate(D-aspartate) O-methyltransferase
MVNEQIESRGIRDPRVLAALRAVPRHHYVPPELEPHAYADRPLPIGHGQTISQPYIVAYMTELLAVEPRHRVLEIGTGSGYQTAVLAELAAEVYTIEIISDLGRQARSLLEQAGYSNIRYLIGDGYRGWPEHAPFDRILLTAAPPRVPQALLDQLAPAGKLLAPVGPSTGDQYLVLIEKDSAGDLRRREDLPVRFVPMVAEEPTKPER